jgi:hypothetical protein
MDGEAATVSIDSAPAAAGSASGGRGAGARSVRLPVRLPAATGSTWWRPRAGQSWQWQLTGPPDLSASVDVFDLDLVDTSAATVAAIHAKGARAICHPQTGAWERGRPDAAAYPASVLGATIGGYSDHRYVDVRALPVLRPLIDPRLDQCKAKGFHGVEPDADDAVIDVGATGIGFAADYAAQITFDRAVATDAHARGLAVGLKDGTFGTDIHRFVADLEPWTDFAVNQECVASGGACGELSAFIKHGKPVFHVEYLDDYPGATPADPTLALAFCRSTRGLGFSSILKPARSAMTAWRRGCPVAPN